MFIIAKSRYIRAHAGYRLMLLRYIYYGWYLLNTPSPPRIWLKMNFSKAALLTDWSSLLDHRNIAADFISAIEFHAIYASPSFPSRRLYAEISYSLFHNFIITRARCTCQIPEKHAYIFDMPLQIRIIYALLYFTSFYAYTYVLGFIINFMP